VLVTGAAGFIGSHLVDHLLAEGWNVLGVDSFDASYDTSLKRRNIAEHLRHDAYSLIEADVRDLRDVRSRITTTVQVVVHIAARTDRLSGVTSPLDAADVNLGGALNLLEFCRMRRVRQFVFASCGSVYGVAPGLPWTEETIPRPTNPLDAAKLAAEQFGHSYSRLYGVQFVGLRLFNVYGPREQPRSMITRLCRALISETLVDVPGDGEARLDLTYVADAVQALRLAMSFGAAPAGIMNVGSGEPVSLSNLIHELESITGKRATLQTVAPAEGDLLDCWADVGKAKRALGYSPKVRLRDGLRRFLDWYMSTAS
jgi:UDP-glucuronate 4-epimerase